MEKNKFIHPDNREIMIFAVDFDETLAEHSAGTYPDMGPPRLNAKEVINRLYDAGHQICIWTCRADNALLGVNDYLIKNGIKFHKLNENADLSIAGIKPFPKMYADMYIDDRGLYGVPADWEEIYDEVIKTLGIKDTREIKSATFSK